MRELKLALCVLSSQNKVPKLRSCSTSREVTGGDLEAEVSHSSWLPGSKLDNGVTQGVCDTQAEMEQRTR